jgi:predicted DNA-binding transcriptional regulator AlpA
MPRLVTEQELAKVLKVKLRTIQKLRREGRLPEPVKLSTKIIRYKADDIAALLDSRGAE